jgi:acetoin utilization deacetylase AcuC-like enzyme
MLTIYSDRHHLHHGKTELIGGLLQPCFEMPSRADIVLARARKVGLGEVREPKAFGLDPVLRVHDAGFVDFLSTAWQEWAATGRTHDALPLVWPVRGMHTDRVPQDIDGKLGYYSMDAGVPINVGTWTAVQDSADVALTGAQLLHGGTRSVFSLCRPPGHHAAADYMGGYCYLNNAAIAAQYLRDQGCERVAILDVDYHHGNGTQSIFYDRSDVLFASIHADPRMEYPSFLGYADETGAGAGAGYNVNYPLALGSAWSSYSQALEDACKKISSYAPQAVVVSLGVDTFEKDPISQFRLKNDDYLRMGEAIGRLKIPTLFVMEGGYAVDDIGINAINVLTGFETAA